ncbi:MAG: hypothetical protein JWM68_5823 [Verrucomicrobiales bacterium]|nr:hypothetical protein [Verrucomicrobiales bacterium]
MNHEEEGPSPKSKPGEIVVFMVRRDARCAECSRALSDGNLLRIEGDKPLCMDCADLGHLEFLPSGNTALTRRATKHSPLRAVVVRWARARKRYERRGILVTPDAIEKAEVECLADEESRACQRERAAVRREGEDREFVARFAEAVRRDFPSCPAESAEKIAAHACLKNSGRVGRTAAAKEFEPRAVELAVGAHIRHVHTNYDELLMKCGDRALAREAIGGKVHELLARWRAWPA